MTKDKNGKNKNGNKNGKNNNKDPKKEPARSRAARRWNWFKKDPTDHKEY